VKFMCRTGIIYQFIVVFFNGPICGAKKLCGSMFEFDQQTGEPELDGDGKIQWKLVYIKCDLSREDPNLPGLPGPDSGICFRK
jgi:hypothetical protein